MRRIAVVIFLSLSPFVAQAACSDDGYTVIFINGVFDTKDEAQTDSKFLGTYFIDGFNGQKVDVQLGYNQTHLAGASDLFESYFPAADGYDLQAILMQMHDQVHTRKLLIVGHSQGAIYANQVYEYLVAHGEPKESVAVYAVATPESYVAGGGSYRNLSVDTVLNRISIFSRFKLLPYNLSAEDYINSNGIDGDTDRHHSFSGTYLSLFPDKLISDMNTELWLLKSEPSSVADGCFQAPKASLGYATKQLAFGVADPVAGVSWVVIKGTYQIASVAVGAVGNLASATYGAVADFLGGQGGKSPGKGEAAATFTFLHALNLTSISGKDAQELLSQDQGGAAVLAVLPDETPSSTEGEVLGVATSTVSQEIAMGSTDASATPELSVPIPQPNPAAGLVSHGDSQGGSSAPAEIVLASDPDAGSPSSSGPSSDSATTSDDVASSTPSAPDPTPPADTTAPSIVSVSPAWGSIGVDAAVPLRIVYDEPIDAATINSGSVYLAHILIGFTGWEVFRTDVSLEADQKTIDITPLGPLVPSEYYSLVAGQTITDLAGNRAAALIAPVTNPQFQVATTSVVN